MIRTINDRELAAILAGLRLYQAARLGTDPGNVEPIATNEGEFRSLDVHTGHDEVDALCEDLNLAASLTAHIPEV